MKAGISAQNMQIALESEVASLYCRNITHLHLSETDTLSDKYIVLNMGGILC